MCDGTSFNSALALWANALDNGRTLDILNKQIIYTKKLPTLTNLKAKLKLNISFLLNIVSYHNLVFCYHSHPMLSLLDKLNLI